MYKRLFTTLLIIGLVLKLTAGVETYATDDDVEVLDVISDEERSIIQNIISDTNFRGDFGRSMLHTLGDFGNDVSESVNASIGNNKPPVLRLTDIKLRDIAETNIYRFNVRLKVTQSDNDSFCSVEDIEMLQNVVCDGNNATDSGIPYQSKCLKRYGEQDNFHSIPIITIDFGSLNELSR